MLFLMERNPVGCPKRHRDVVRIMRGRSSERENEKKKRTKIITDSRYVVQEISKTKRSFKSKKKI